MILLATIALVVQAPATAADFFPLTPGLRRTYEEKSPSARTVIEEIGKTMTVEGQPAIGVIRKTKFNQILDTAYYRIEGSTVFLVGYGDDRSLPPPAPAGGTVDLTAKPVRTHVVMPFLPALPLFRFEGKPTAWTYSEIPKLDGTSQGEMAISGSSKLGGVRDVLGRKVETLEVRVDVQVGEGELGQKIVETSVYGRGIGLIESSRKTIFGKKTTESKSRLTDLSETREGG